jgi:hypothetical protein
MRRVSAFLWRHLLMTFVALVLLAVLGGLWISSVPITLSIRIVGSMVVLAIALLIWLPKWQAARPELENEARKTLAEIIGGAAVLGGLLFTWENLRATQENLKFTQESLRIAQDTATKSHDLTREGQITERFSKAIDQLGAVNEGKKQLEIRLGGIHALARIAKDSKDYHWPIMEVLTAYVREHAPWPPKDAQPPTGDQTPQEEPPTTQRPARPAAEIQAILTVIGRRTRTFDRGERETYTERLNLTNTDLRGADLQRADLRDVDFRGANFQGADLQRARLHRADLRGATNLTIQQLSTVRSLYKAFLDPELEAQITPQYRHLREKP